MNSFTGTVSLLDLGSINLALLVSETLMVGQSSEIIVAEGGGNNIGHFEYAQGQQLPAYSLNEKLFPSKESQEVNTSPFCVGLKTSQETDSFVLLCQQFEQIEVSEQTHSIQQLPSFMYKERSLIEGLFQHQEKVYFITSPDKLLEHIASSNSGLNQEINHA